jgi:hypothetical protein
MLIGCRFLAGETATIYVGPDRQEFKVSKDLLCYVSPFFKAAFEGEFKEGKEQTMELLEDDVEAFSHVVSYMYRSTFGCLEDIDKHPAGCYRCSAKVSTSIYLLELSERLQIAGMKSAAIADLVWVLHHNDTPDPTVEDVELAFNMLPADSKGIETLVEYVADHFLRADSKNEKQLVKTWKYEPLMTTVEGFDVLLLFAVKKLAVERLGLKHLHRHPQGQCPGGWAGCQSCSPETSWRAPHLPWW